MSKMKMSDVEKFKEWHLERMGHPLGVILGINAVSELELEVKRLKVDREGLIQAGYDANSSLRSDNDRMVEEIAELRSFAKKVSGLHIETFHFEAQGGYEDCFEYACTDIVNDAKELLAKLNQKGEE